MTYKLRDQGELLSLSELGFPWLENAFDRLRALEGQHGMRTDDVRCGMGRGWVPGVQEERTLSTG